MTISHSTKILAFLILCVAIYFKWPSNELQKKEGDAFQETPGHHLAGLILARGGSKGITKKNIAKLHGKPLIHWALQAMVDSGVFTSIWVSTDDPIISDWVIKAFNNVKVHQRVPYTATDEATSLIAVQEFINAHPEIDAIGLVQATSPFVKPVYLQQAVSKLSEHDSVFSVYRSRALRWSVNSTRNDYAFTHPLNFDPKSRPRRQDWDGEMVENGMFYFAMKSVIMQEGRFQGTRTAYVEVPLALSLEIDTPKDLAIAEFLMNNYDIFDETLTKENEQI